MRLPYSTTMDSFRRITASLLIVCGLFFGAIVPAYAVSSQDAIPHTDPTLSSPSAPATASNPTTSSPCSSSDQTGLCDTASQISVITTRTTLEARISRLITIFISLLGTIFFFMMLYAGWLWMSAGGGDSKKVQEAQGLIKNAVIGLIVIFLAYAATRFVFTNILSVVGK